MMTFRQGDVLLKKIKQIPVGAKRVEPIGRLVLAYGEVTGHAHAIHDLENLDVFVTEGTMYLEAKNAVDLKHEEHGTITLPRGHYERIIQREYSPEAIRNVAD